jgi:hypothetical protein
MRTKCVPPLTNFEDWSYKLGNKPLKLQYQKLALMVPNGCSTRISRNMGSRTPGSPPREQNRAPWLGSRGARTWIDTVFESAPRRGLPLPGKGRVESSGKQSGPFIERQGLSKRDRGAATPPSFSPGPVPASDLAHGHAPILSASATLELCRASNRSRADGNPHEAFSMPKLRSTALFREHPL